MFKLNVSLLIFSKEEKAEEKRENRIVDNWRRLVKGLFIREKIQAKYMKKK